MKKKGIALMIIAGVFLFTSASAQTPSTALKVDGAYQFATFEGYRTHTYGFGASIEKSIGYSRKSVEFIFNYMMRTDGDDDTRLVPRYDDILYFALGGRQYASYETPMNGGYVGLLFGVGIPPEQGVYWDFDFTLGYQLLKNKVLVDVYTAIGFCSFNYREDYPLGSVYYYYPGFVFRPGIRFGLAF